MKDVSLKKIAMVVTAVFTAGSLLIAAATIFMSRQLAALDTDFSVYEEDSDPNSLALRAVKGNLGYGGMIHEFKNFVLRGGDQRKARLDQSVGAAMAGLQTLRESLGPSHQQDIDAIMDTVTQYAQAAKEVASHRSDGWTIEEIDKAVKIDDGPALKALANLRDAVGAQTRDTRFGLLVALRSALGYGGMIHQFKNLVLRKDAPRVQKVDAAAKTAKEAIARYRQLKPSPEEEAALQEIEATIDSYLSMAPKVLSMGTTGKAAAEIDGAVKISDGPALAGLTQLGLAAQEEIARLRIGMHDSLNRAWLHSLIIAIGSLAGMVTLSLGLYFAIQKHAVRPARKIADGLQALAQGDTSVNLSDLSAETEIGEIARVSATFRDALIRNNEMVEKQRAHVQAQEKMAAEQAELLEDQKRMHAAQQEDHAQSMKSQAERERLQAAVQEVIAHALKGELSHRIDEHFEEDTLASLADGVNLLMDTVTNSFDDLLKAMDGLSQGNFTGRIEGAHAGDFATLQQSVNSALAELSGLIGQVTEGAGEILREAEVISDATVGLGERTERHAHELEATTDALSHLSDSIGAVTKHAQDAATNVSEVGDTSTEIRSVMQEANTSMERIVESSGQISKVTALIEEISFQTNLLALNAGNEAARAGDAGRGFAVVASEVRALAQRSGEAVSEINTLIQKSRTDIDVGAKQVTTARNAVDGISASMNELMAGVTAVAASCTEQTQAVSGITTAMNRIESVSQQNAAMFEETAASTKTLHVSAENLLRMSDAFVVSKSPPQNATHSTPSSRIA